MFEIEFYQEDNGNSPVDDFIDSLPMDEQNSVYSAIENLQKGEAFFKMPYSEKIDDEIFCLRKRYKNKRFRMLYFFYHNGKIIITNGFIKKRRKTPPNEIRIAKKRMINYLEREKRDENI